MSDDLHALSIHPCGCVEDTWGRLHVCARHPTCGAPLDMETITRRAADHANFAASRGWRIDPPDPSPASDGGRTHLSRADIVQAVKDIRAEPELSHAVDLAIAHLVKPAQEAAPGAIPAATADQP
jgi:hypothetical protein